MSTDERQKVFITGGAGFIARAIYRRAKAESWPWEFTCYSRSDEKHRALNERYPQVGIVRGDITTPDVQHLAAAMRGHDIVIHAAATKYVDRSEFAALDTIRINTLGSMNVMEAAFLAGVQRIVGISTDKAVAPVNIYGATKMAMERAFQDYASLTAAPQISLVRYGNVIGSTGSVIPLFKKQLADNGRVTITNPDMTRFWMSADEAIKTILHALNDTQQGGIALPSDLRAMRIIDVAHAAIGMDHVDRIVTVGERPGEKAHETLLAETEGPRTIWHEDWVELRPPGETPNGERPSHLELTSDHAPPMSAVEMANLIADAEAV